MMFAEQKVGSYEFLVVSWALVVQILRTMNHELKTSFAGGKNG